ncbi:cAMP-specific phosphodiesterase [Trypanosoma brucei brucei TREU927]|uniref:Phosphodiesterase n=1 Tax=Trypanosoma brucei brucei (strain 927/4 GUTat10.1) TaxID=185431 RepID=Q38F42_TRYB2|nr:cAMP-specific phosphodiesterase [Trypanosoma brucei brucei TREU927]EAN76578.1 cAMP-specific phosphodiesterase [Trypanosoma brucei brucei TREU927]
MTHNGGRHLLEAVTLCGSILTRYKRSNMKLDEAEVRALKELFEKYQDILVDGSPGLPTHASGPMIQPPVTNMVAPYDSPTDTIVKFVEGTINLQRPIVEVLHVMNEHLSLVLRAKNTHVFYVDPVNNLLYDPIHGVAAALDESSPIGKAIVSGERLNVAGTLYIPIISEGMPLGCVLSPCGRADYHASTMLESSLRVISTSLKNIIQAEKLNWNKEKAEAMLRMATQLARDNLEETVLASSIMNTVKSLTESARCSLFLVRGDVLEAHFEDGNVVTIPRGAGIAGYVAQTGETVNIVDAYADDRFNREVDKATGYRTKTILCMPVMYEGTIVAVAQLINKLDLTTESGLRLPRVFGRRDEELFQTFSMFAGASLRNCRINDRLLKEKKKSDVILDVVTVLSNTDIRDVDGIVRHALHGAKKLLNADRSTLFLVDKERNELCSRMADSVAGKEIRFPCGQGIAGTVAASGVGENIQDAYQDPRFNREVDKQLGYRTQAILCEPIILNGEILAVVQLVNKLDSSGEVTVFTEDDRDTFRVFSLFAGISINNSHLLEFAVKAGREVMELNEHRATLFNKNVPSRGVKRVTAITNREREAVLRIEFPNVDVTDIDFDLFQARESTDKPLDVAAAIAYRLLLGSGLPQKFGCSDEVLLNFILQCRKKYRNVPYHNFYHVVDVCQTIYTFLYRGNVYEKLTELECFVLLITALVHDLDHMGLNNSFYLKTESPLGILSSASGNKSVLEVHHCNLAVEILSDPESDVFGGLEGAERTLAFRSMIDCVLATDMARHSEFLEKYLELMKTSYNVDDSDHRQMTMDVLMKAGDISNVTKPFDISRQWAMAVTEEFYRQGDMEKERGVEVLPMFDRSKNMELAKGQIGFIDFVAAPFFQKIVDACLQGMQWTVDRTKSNRAQWERVLEARSTGASS